MDKRSRLCLRSFVCAFAVALFTLTASLAATKTVDLDANSANGAESQCDLNVFQTFPVQFENKVTNKTGGDAFSFTWPSAGPGGFSSSVTAGTAGGVGAKWVWTTNQSVFAYTGSACDNDICFSKTAGPDPLGGACSLCTDDGVAFTLEKGPGPGETTLNWQGGQGPYTVARAAVARTIGDAASTLLTTDLLRYTDTPPAGTIFYYRVRATSCVFRKSCSTDVDCFAATDGTCINRGPFGVPGRSLASSNVTVSAASLTSSLITFFSPPTEVFRVTSTAGPGGVNESVTNTGSQAVTLTIPAYPPGCCPADGKRPHQLRCGETCVDYLYDPDNCGACGNVCGEGTYCWYGSCLLDCGEGQDDCYGECVSLYDDNANCGECGNVCDGDSCCLSGVCTPPCAEGRTYCNFACVDLDNDADNCGACGNACGTGSCCQGGECISLVCDYPNEPYGWDLCGEECVQTIVDDSNCGSCGNVCGEGTCCNSEGGCGPVCGADTLCGDQCTQLDNDSNNCGACGNACGAGSCCFEGECTPLECDLGEALCAEGCVDLDSNPDNCGECGAGCDGECCYGGACGSELASLGGCETPSPHPPNICPNPYPVNPGPLHCYPQAGAQPATCPNEQATGPEGSQCDTARSHKHARAVHAAPGPLGGSGNDAPVCITGETTQTIEPGQSATTCTPGGRLFKEVPTSITVCGAGIPGIDGQCGDTNSKATTGTFNRLVADPTTPVGDAYVTPYRVHVIDDASQDGLLEPGESAGLLVEVLNAGTMDITDATATLSAPDIDLSEDGIDNPVGLIFGGASVPYGTIPGTPIATNCTAQPAQPAANQAVFPITVPPNHPGDTSHPVTLTVTGTVNGGPFSMDVPLALGIAGGCDPAARTRDSDGLFGLIRPMGDLVEVGRSVPFAPYPFVAGKKRLLSLRLSCGSENLTDADVDPPEIVALSEAVRGPIDTSTLWDERQHAFSRFFTWNQISLVEDQALYDFSWEYELRTTSLGTGTFTITIRIAGRKDYVTSFVLY